MTAQSLINYATANGMNTETYANKYGDKFVGIEWKNNHVWYWFTEFSDGHLFFNERYSMRNGTSKRGFNRTAINIEKTVESFS